MVSDLSQACLDGDLNKVNQLLLQASPLDIEEKGASPFLFFFCQTSLSSCSPSRLTCISSPSSCLPKDQDGVTPLIGAVKNGHHDVVKALLGHGVPHILAPYI